MADQSNDSNGELPSEYNDINVPMAMEWGVGSSAILVVQLQCTKCEVCWSVAEGEIVGVASVRIVVWYIFTSHLSFHRILKFYRFDKTPIHVHG